MFQDNAEESLSLREIIHLTLAYFDDSILEFMSYVYVCVCVATNHPRCPVFRWRDRVLRAPVQ